jgi:hypothetical protein
MIPIRKLAFILGLLLIAPRAEAEVLQFNYSGKSVNDQQGSTTGYTATASLSIDSSAFIYTTYSIGIGANGTLGTEIVALAAALTSFSASLTTPLGNRQFGLSDVVNADPSDFVYFDLLPSGQIIFVGHITAFTNPFNPIGFLNLGDNSVFNYASNPTANHVNVHYSGNWSTPQISGGFGAPLSDIGTGLPALLFIGGLLLWRWRRQRMSPVTHKLS